MSYLAYCGIGSRETPAHILTIMHHIGAYLCCEGWTLRSGGAQGADQAFEAGADQQEGYTLSADTLPKKEIYIPWKGFNNSTSQLHPENVPFNQTEIELAARFHPAWYRCSPSAKRMHTRNVRQILGSEYVNGPTVTPVKFVVCWTEGGLMKGGTSQALRIAQSCDIPIFNLGVPTVPETLEAMVMGIDSFQKKFKSEPVAA